MKKKIIRALPWLVAFAAALLLAAIVSAIVCYYGLSTKTYAVAMEGIEHETKIVLINDLHAREFGQRNCRLVEAIAAQRPDAIFMVGDMVNYPTNDEEIQIVDRLVEDLLDVAPVYYSLGNTELQTWLDGGLDFVSHMRSLGAASMLDDYMEAEIGGNRIRIGFSMGHYNYTKEQWENPPDYAMEAAVGADGTPAIVLLHMPESFIKDIHDWWTGDLYLCGHTHGGLWQIPGIGGVYAPTQRWFPKYDRGQFSFDDGKFDMIINAGLAGHGRVPRLFNMPEISVITLTGK